MMELLGVPVRCSIEINEISDASLKESSIAPMPGLESASEESLALANVPIRIWEQAFHKDR